MLRDFNIRARKVATDHNIADIFTKALPGPTHRLLTDQLLGPELKGRSNAPATSATSGSTECAGKGKTTPSPSGQLQETKRVRFTPDTKE